MSCRACALPVAVCCRAGLRIPVTAADVERAGPTLAVGDMPLRPDGTCVHLSPDDACTIYDARPAACRDQDPFFCRAAAARGAA